MTHTELINNKIGENTKIWSFSVVIDSNIGNNVNIGSLCEIYKAQIGNNTRIGKGSFICEGVQIDDDCFIGPHTCFTNDKTPNVSSEYKSQFIPLKTHVMKGAKIGANVTILPGLIIGEYSTIGAGSVVTKNVPSYETWCGNPARRLYDGHGRRT